MTDLKRHMFNIAMNAYRTKLSDMMKDEPLLAPIAYPVLMNMSMFEDEWYRKFQEGKNVHEQIIDLIPALKNLKPTMGREESQVERNGELLEERFPTLFPICEN